MPLPTSLRIALCFIVVLWLVSLLALAIGAPGDIIFVTALIGTVAAVVEWGAHQPHARDEPPRNRIDVATSPPESAPNARPQPRLARKH